MPELQIIGGSASNFVWVCRIACAEKGVAYTHVPAFPHSPEVDAIHPFGKIPVMRHGDVSLCESRAIVSYIDRVFAGPPLLPSDAATSAGIEQWVSMVCTTIDPLWVRRYLAAYIVPGTPDKSPNRAAIEAALPLMEPQFKVMDQKVARTGHLHGDGFTLADAYFLPIVHYMGKFPESAALLRKFDNLGAYYERHIKRKSVADAAPTELPGPRR
jgi:glutathione S-transferase